jgi:protein TonB
MQPALVIFRWIAVNAAAIVGGFAITLGLFLILPVLEAISAPADADLLVRDADVAALPPPPPPPPPEEKEEEKAEDEPPPPPKLAEETPPLDLSQLELALNVGMGGAGVAGDFAVKLPVDAKTAAEGGAGGDEALFSLSDLDQKPRAIFQPSPSIAPKLRKKTPATVYVIFTVDPRGRVENPLVQSSSNPEFDAAALAAVKQWKFEPGKRGGQSVRFRMRVPITFPKGS